MYPIKILNLSNTEENDPDFIIQTLKQARDEKWCLCRSPFRLYVEGKKIQDGILSTWKGRFYWKLQRSMFTSLRSFNGKPGFQNKKVPLDLECPYTTMVQFDLNVLGHVKVKWGREACMDTVSWLSDMRLSVVILEDVGLNDVSINIYSNTPILHVFDPHNVAPILGM